jgi:hypothetical protein
LIEFEGGVVPKQTSYRNISLLSLSRRHHHQNNSNGCAQGLVTDVLNLSHYLVNTHTRLPYRNTGSYGDPKKMGKKMNVGKYLAADIKHAILDYQNYTKQD